MALVTRFRFQLLGGWRCMMFLRFQALLLLTFQFVGVRGIVGAELKPETVEGFARYVQATEKHIDQQVARPDRFLYIDGLADTPLTSLKNGQTYMHRLETRDDSGRAITTPGGLIHHWIGDVFIPGASLIQVLDLVEDYNHHQDIYEPDVVRSRIVTRNGNDFKVEMRFRKKKVITVTLNTEHDVHYSELDSTHWYSRSVSTRIAEVEDADKPGEREKPVGHDGGFLWRINSYWRFVERDGGVYVECESVSLTRDIPPGLGWLIKGLVTSVSRQSLEHTLKSTRSGALARLAAPHR
jgi:hypothetical protein